MAQVSFEHFTRFGSVLQPSFHQPRMARHTVIIQNAKQSQPKVQSPDAL
jgi:hypothetical protein